MSLDESDRFTFLSLREFKVPQFDLPLFPVVPYPFLNRIDHGKYRTDNGRQFRDRYPRRSNPITSKLPPIFIPDSKLHMSLA